MLKYLFTFLLLTNSAIADTVKIGLLVPLSGSRADAGQMMKNGISLALEEFNDDPKHKYKLELLSEDSAQVIKDTNNEAKPQVNSGVIAGFNKLVQFGVHYIIGPYSYPEIQAISALSTESKTIVLNATARADELSQSGPYIFRVIHSMSDEALFFSRFVGVSMASPLLHFVTINSPLSDSYVKVFQSALPKHGKAVGAVEKFEPASTDMRPQILRIRRQNPTDIFVIGTPKQVGLVMRQAADWKIKAQFYSIEAENPDLISAGGELANGLFYVTSYDNESNEPAVQNFATKFRERFKTEPGLVSAAAHDALMVVGECIDVEGDHVEQVKLCMQKTKDFPGASGAFSLDENGQAQRSFVVKTVREGKFKKVM